MFVLAVAVDVPAVPESASGSDIKGSLRPLSNHKPLVLGGTHVHVVGEEVRRGPCFIPVVEELQVHFMLLQKCLDVAKVARIPADSVQLVSQDEIESPGSNVGL